MSADVLDLGPYGTAALDYLTAGWEPIPLPADCKAPPPHGFTGYAGRAVTSRDVDDWCNGARLATGDLARLGNLAVRLADGVLGLDVDAYGGKAGAETLADHEARLGALPATFRTTSRTGSADGIRLFRVPVGRRWANALDGGGVEVIHHGHRYALAWPSLHPGDVGKGGSHPPGSVYRWHDDRRGRRLAEGRIPHAERLPALPEAWLTALDRGPVGEVLAPADKMAARALLDGLADGETCKYVSHVLDRLAAYLSGGDSRHDSTTPEVFALVRAGEQGHRGVAAALDTAEALFLSALAGSGEARERGAVAEFARMVNGAAAKCAADPTPDERRGCCGEFARRLVVPEFTDESSDMDLTPLSAVDPTADPAALITPEFWTGTPFYRSLFLFARARDVSPLAVLMCVLARAAAMVSPAVVLDKYRGAHMSLNVFVALSTVSGGDKSIVIAAAADFLDVHGGLATDFLETGSGTGEGLLATYCHVKQEKGKPPAILQHRYSVLLVLDEVSALEAVSGRKGSTAVSFYTAAWGAALLTTQNAEVHRLRRVERHRYRLAIICGVQPLKADVILSDTESGFAQRWLWTPTNDPYRPDDADDLSRRPAEPPPYSWRVPGPWSEPVCDPETGEYDFGPIPPRRVLDLPPEAVAALSARLNNRPTLAALTAGSAGTLDSHAVQLRARVAALLALVHERTEVSADDWQRAGLLMEVSRAERSAVLKARGREAARDADRVAVRRGRSEFIAADTAAETRTLRCMAVIRSALKRNPGEQPSNTVLNKYAGSRYRDVARDALVRLTGSGELVAEERTADNGKPTTYYRLAVES